MNSPKYYARFAAPFQQECRSGCKNNVAVNGLGNYVSLWVSNARKLTLNPVERRLIDEIANLFGNYEESSPTQRRDIIQTATFQIDKILGEIPEASATVERPTLIQASQNAAAPRSSAIDVRPPALGSII